LRAFLKRAKRDRDPPPGEVEETEDKGVTPVESGIIVELGMSDLG
jgi:hypothetical protein